MEQKKKSKTKPIIIAALCVIVVFISSGIFIRRNDAFDKAIISGQPIRFMMILYGNKDVLPGEMDIYLVAYEKDTNLLKAASINPDTVVFRKNVRAESLKNTFYKLLAKKGAGEAVKNLRTDLSEMTNGGFDADFYIVMDYANAKNLIGRDKKMRALLVNRSFEYKDLEYLNRLDLIEACVNTVKGRLIRTIWRVRSNYKDFDTNISKRALTDVLGYAKLKKCVAMYCEVPVKYRKTRVEPDSARMRDFFENVFYGKSLAEDAKFLKIEIKNTTSKPRMAEKAAWHLRSLAFDVYDWVGVPGSYKTTVIKDNKGNFGAALQVAKALGVGRVITVYDGNAYADITIMIGEDCDIKDRYDVSRDKIRDKNKKIKRR